MRHPTALSGPCGCLPTHKQRIEGARRTSHHLAANPSVNTPERTRTSNLLVRSQLLYPIELRALRGPYPNPTTRRWQSAGPIPANAAPPVGQDLISDTYIIYNYHVRSAAERLSAWITPRSQDLWWV